MHRVRLEASTTASSNQLDWVALQTNALDAAGHGVFGDPGAAGLEARFYRAVDLDSGFALSTNVVGFVNRTVPDGIILIGNPFWGSNLRITNLLAELPNGISVYKVGPDGEPSVNNCAFGWSDSAMRLLPGEGALLENRSGSNFVVTFNGEVVQGMSTNCLPAAPALCSSTIPQAGVLDTELGLPCLDDDVVYLWTGADYRAYGYSFGGWLDPQPPRVGLGEAFWVWKSGAAEWIRDLVITEPGALAYTVTNHALDAQRAKINFVTCSADPAFGRVFDSTVGAPLGSSFSGQLYAGTSSDDGSLVAIGSPVNFLDGTGAGYIRSGLVRVLDFVEDTTVCLQLRVWETARGSSYELARANGGRVGKSEPFWVSARKDFFWSGLPSPANGFVSFSLTGATTIVKQPLSQTRPIGGKVTFSVTTIAVPPRSYQWWHSDGTNQVALGTAPSLTLTNLTWADAGTYWVTISNAVGVVASELAILSIFGPPEIRVNGEVQTGNTLTLTDRALVELSSSLSDGRLFYTLNDTDPARGLMYFGAFEVRHSATLRAVVYTGDFSQWLTNGAFFLNILEAPVITKQPPQSLLLPVGGNATLEIEAGGNPPPHCQWQFEGAGLPGATNFVLHLANVQLADDGRYAAVVTNLMGAVTSKVVAVTVRTPPSVVVLPGSTNIPLGSNITFYAQATGSPPLIFQWRKNGVNIPGATNDSLTITNVQLRDGGSYSVVVANDVGAATSDPALLIVEVPTTVAPPGDDFAARVSLGTNVFAAGTNWFATRETDEPYHAGKFGSNSVWYTWRAPAHGIATFRTVGSTFDTLLGVYTNDLAVDPQPSLTNLGDVVSDEDRGGYLTSEARFNALEDVEYQLAVDGFAGQQGAFTLSLEFEPTAQALPEITREPSSQTVTQGATVTISVAANGAELRYQWYLNGNPIDGATSTNLTLTNVQFDAVGYYTVAITNDDRRGVVSLPAILEMGGQPRTVVSEDKWEDWVFSPPGGLGALLRLAAATPGAESPILVGAGMFDFQVFDNSTNSTPEDHCSRMMNATRWLYLRTTNEGTLRLDTLGSAIPTILAVYLSEGGVLRPLDCAATNAPDGRGTLLWIDAASGRTYAIAVDGNDRQTGDIRLNWVLGEAPEITATTRTYLVRRGSQLTLRPGVSSGLPTNSTYQWFLEGHPLEGATNRTLALPNVQRTDTGDYSVRVRNLIGSVWHEAATVDLDLTQLTLAESTFEGGNDGWGLSGDVTNLTFQATDGNPDGCLVAYDRHIGGMWYWMAPALYLGNLADAYGGWLQFDLWQSATTLHVTNRPDVVLIGGGLTLCFNTATNPGLAWTSYKVPLHEAWGWTKDTLDGATATKAELLQVLSNLTALQIRGEFSSEADYGGLDNVAVLAPTPPLVILRGSGNQILLRWPVYPPGFQPEYASDVLEPAWFTNLPPATPATDTNWYRMAVPLGEDTRFFRLRKR